MNMIAYNYGLWAVFVADCDQHVEQQHNYANINADISYN